MTNTTNRELLAHWPTAGRPVRALCVGLVLLIVVMHAQVRFSIVFGTITLRNNQPAAGVSVSLAGNLAYTDNAGRYRIDKVPVGAQEMLISSGGKVLFKAKVNISSGTQRIDQKLP
jgi:hypothetical protein